MFLFDGSAHILDLDSGLAVLGYLFLLRSATSKPFYYFGLFILGFLIICSALYFTVYWSCLDTKSSKICISSKVFYPSFFEPYRFWLLPSYFSTIPVAYTFFNLLHQFFQIFQCTSASICPKTFCFIVFYSFFSVLTMFGKESMQKMGPKYYVHDNLGVKKSWPPRITPQNSRLCFCPHKKMNSRTIRICGTLFVKTLLVAFTCSYC